MKPPHVSYKRFFCFLLTMFFINLLIFFYVDLVWNGIMAFLIAALIIFLLYDWHQKGILKNLLNTPSPPKH